MERVDPTFTRMCQQDAILRAKFNDITNQLEGVS